MDSVLGKGSCFRIHRRRRRKRRRDLKPTTLGEKPVMPARTARSLADAATILLAEDNKVNQMLAVRTLEKGGYRVLVANNGVEAVQITQEQPVDLILMDIQMPEMDGFQATAKIRSSRVMSGNKPIPVIAMTAHALKGDRERCLDGGMTDYISKPVRPADLLKLVAHHVREIRSRHEDGSRDEPVRDTSSPHRPESPRLSYESLRSD